MQTLPLDRVSWFILNEIEGRELSGEREPEKILFRLNARYPHAQIVLTLGSEGSVYAGHSERIAQSAYAVRAVDKAAAGDTFTGFFFASIAEGVSVEEALRRASKASSISVTRAGAATSIPTRVQVLAALDA